MIARNADVRCRDVTATFGNGQTQQIFRGFLSRGRNVEVTLPNGCDAGDLSRSLSDLTGELGVECSLHPSEADIL